MEAFDAYWVPLGWAKERPSSRSRGSTRRARVRWAPAPSRSRASPGRQTAASRRSRSGSTAVAGGPPVVTDLGLDVGAVGLRLEQHAGQPPHRGACHRQHGRGPDRPAHAACTRWRSWLALGGRDRRLSRAQIGIESSHAATSLHLRSTGALRDRDDREPGQRTFFLQARDGGRVVSVALEKVQVAVLADRLGQLLGELDKRGIAPEDPSIRASRTRAARRASTRRSAPER